MHRLRIGDPLFLHGGGLGLKACLVYNALDTNEGQRRKDLTQATGLRPEQVSPALRRLTEIGAAYKGSDGYWYRSFAFDPDAVARERGLRSKMAVRDARMEREAAQHAAAAYEAYERRQRAAERPPAPSETPRSRPSPPTAAPQPPTSAPTRRAS